MSSPRQLWILAGGNGAGKSSFYHSRLEPSGLPFINADLIATELFPEQANQPDNNSYAAARVAAAMRERLLRSGRSFCFETVFSHPSKVDFTAQARSAGYHIVLVVIHLDDVALNKARISQRVAAGGHAVPDEKVEQRIPRLLQQLRSAIPLCDEVYLLDNSSAENPFSPVARVHHGQVNWQSKPPPQWARLLLQN